VLPLRRSISIPEHRRRVVQSALAVFAHDEEEALTERPILFSGAMVRSIREGRKTQTRRVVKPQPNRRPYPVLLQTCPYGVPGDRLWVRETLRTHGYFGFPLGECPQVKPMQGRVWSYAADEVPDWTGSRPSIHMPRWACRLVLELTAVRVERLQDISEADAKAEGVDLRTPSHYDKQGRVVARAATYVVAYRTLWNSLNAKRGFGWDVNPWVWVLEFKRLANV
jgi:hypothetical protein